MMIVCDDREPEEYRKLADRVARLNCDIAVFGGERVIRIERKTPSDLLSSLESGRLNNQLANVDELIVVDTKAEWTPRGVFDTLYGDSKLRGILNGINEHHPTKMAENIDDYFRILRNIERKLVDGTYATMRVHARIDHTFDTPEIGFIASLPGIGEELAKQVMDYYHTPLSAIINVKNWSQDIRGIGKRKIDIVLRFLKGGNGVKKHIEVEENTEQLRKDMKAQIDSLSQLAEDMRPKPRPVRLRRRSDDVTEKTD